jgi:hypothetical protein
MADMNQGQGKALRELLFRMLKMMLKAYLLSIDCKNIQKQIWKVSSSPDVRERERLVAAM